MIFHFLKRDFISNRWSWVCMAGVSFLLLTASIFTSEKVLGLYFVFYIFFMVIPLGGILGSQWRSQHTMSRAYLLSLPVSRSYMFFLIQVRILTFGLPLLLFCICLPWFAHAVLKEFSFLNYFLYLVTTFAAIFWAVNSFIHMVLMQELAFSTHFSRVKRFLNGLWLAARGILEISIVMYGAFCVAITHHPWREWTWLAVCAVVSLSGFQHYQSRKEWLGT